MKRLSGSGSIVQLEKNKPRSKCRKWKLVVSTGRDPATGKYRQKSRNFWGTYTEAKRELESFRASIENESIVEPSSWTFNEYAEHYVNARVAAGEIQERTTSTLRTTFRQLGYHIGGMKLQEITPMALEQAYMNLRNGKSISGRPLSGTTLFNINVSAYRLFEDARKKNLIEENPLEKVPAPRKDTKRKRALSTESFYELVESLDPTNSMQCAVLLCLTLGLRRSEALGLSWGDIDFTEQTVNVHVSSDEHGNLKEPKSESGYRIIPLTNDLAAKLLKRKEAQVIEYLETSPRLVISCSQRNGRVPSGAIRLDGKAYDLDSDTPLIADAYGKRTTPHALSEWWPRNRKKFGVEGWCLHELRHSFLTLAAQSGVHPAVMQQLAGHSSAQTTMEIYTHINMFSKRAALDAMQETLRSYKNEAGA